MYNFHDEVPQRHTITGFIAIQQPRPTRTSYVSLTHDPLFSLIVLRTEYSQSIRHLVLVLNLWKEAFSQIELHNLESIEAAINREIFWYLLDCPLHEKPVVLRSQATNCLLICSAAAPSTPILIIRL